jgi:hypothetical protein
LKDPLERGTKIMPDEQSVADMVDEVLARQAAYRASLFRFNHNILPATEGRMTGQKETSDG